MPLVETILAVAMTLPVYYRDIESDSARLERLNVIAEAVSQAGLQATCQGPYNADSCTRSWAGSARELSTLLLTLAWFETRLAEHIHGDRCGRYECDSYRRNGQVFHRAKSLWQLHASRALPQEMWEQIGGVGQSNTTLAAKAAARRVSVARNRCGKRQPEWAVGTFGGYATGGSCEWKPAVKRAKLFRKLLATRAIVSGHKKLAELRAKLAERSARLGAVPQS